MLLLWVIPTRSHFLLMLFQHLLSRTLTVLFVHSVQMTSSHRLSVCKGSVIRLVHPVTSAVLQQHVHVSHGTLQQLTANTLPTSVLLELSWDQELFKCSPTHILHKSHYQRLHRKCIAAEIRSNSQFIKTAVWFQLKTYKHCIIIWCIWAHDVSLCHYIITSY